MNNNSTYSHSLQIYHDNDEAAWHEDAVETRDGLDDSDEQEGIDDADDEHDDGEEEGKPKGVKRARTVWKNSHLPEEVMNKNRWQKVFLPTVVRYAGALLNPWSMDDEDELKRVLELMWKVIFGSLGISYTDQLHVIVRFLVCLFWH